MNDRHDWHIVQIAPPPHARCAVSGFGDGPFIDFGVRMNAIDPNVLIQVDVAKDVGRFVGMVTAEEHIEQINENDRLRDQLEQLEAKVQELERFKESIDYLAPQGLVPRKLPGRPKNTEKKVAA